MLCSPPVKCLRVLVSAERKARYPTEFTHTLTRTAHTPAQLLDPCSCTAQKLKFVARLIAGQKAVEFEPSWNTDLKSQTLLKPVCRC